MNKRHILFIACILIHVLGKAQITLTAADYPSIHIGADSLMVTTYNSAITPCTAGTDNIWDMSTVTDSTAIIMAYRVGDTVYQYADSNNSKLFNYTIIGRTRCNILSSSISQFGINIVDTSYYLSIAAGAFDSLIIPAQSVFFTNPSERLAFPCNYSNVWSSAYFYDIQYKLSIAAYSYHDTPGFVRSYINERDSVTGWGHMRVKDVSGSPSEWWDVLQVRSIRVKRDSFFLNGVPAPGVLLSLLGMTQGKTDTTWEDNFYRKGELSALCRVQYKDMAYSQAKKAWTHVQRLVHPNNGVPLLGDKKVRVYPNPIAAGKLLVLDGLGDGVQAYALKDALGRIVANGTVEKGVIQIPAALLVGCYYLEVGSEGVRVEVRYVIVVKVWRGHPPTPPAYRQAGSKGDVWRSGVFLKG